MKPFASLLAILSLCIAPASFAQDIEVDLELVLMVDVSRSMTERELEIQRRGYAAALRSDDVFADALTSRFDPTFRRTSISGALDFGAEHMLTNAYVGLRRVIDISGDGPNNQGRAVERARDAVLAQGIVINGLPLLTREGMGLAWHIDELDVYYRNCVIGGPGAFVIPVTDWDDFAEAVRRKLVLEIASAPMSGLIIPAQAEVHDPSDCLIGEKIWQERRNRWVLP